MDPTRLPKIMIDWYLWEGKNEAVPEELGKMRKRGLRMGEWNSRRQWNMEVGRRIYIYIYIYIHTHTHKGERCVGLTTLSPSCAACLENWEPQPPGNLRAPTGIASTFFYLPLLLYGFVADTSALSLSLSLYIYIYIYIYMYIWGRLFIWPISLVISGCISYGS